MSKQWNHFIAPLLMEGSLIAPRPQGGRGGGHHGLGDIKMRNKTNKQHSLRDRWWGYRKSHELGVTIQEDI